jgi:dUTP pyrophosphatase
VTAVIYVATPIDQAGDSVPDLPWKRVVKAAKFNASAVPGVIAFHPAHAFSVAEDAGITPTLEVINRAALSASGGLVAVIPKGVPTVGVPRELEQALSTGKPVAVVTDLGEKAFSLADVPRFTLDYTGFIEATTFVRDEIWLREGTKTIGPRELVWHAVGHGQVPTRAHDTDAGFDLYVSQDAVIPPGGFVDVQTDVRVAMPPGMWGRIVGRSSTRRRRGLLVVEGVIDAGYRGLIYTGVQNMGEEPITVQIGERLAQFIPHVNVAGMVVNREVNRREFDVLPHDGRGEGGFGSSGA